MFSTMKSRLWQIAAVLLLSLMVATLVDAFYLELERQEYRQSLDTRIQREGDNLQQLTSQARGWGRCSWLAASTARSSKHHCSSGGI
ncbi:hypothetical protein ACSZMW_01260 [Aeromonas allosaccharophila]